MLAGNASCCPSAALRTIQNATDASYNATRYGTQDAAVPVLLALGDCSAVCDCPCVADGRKAGSQTTLQRCWNDAGTMLERCWNDAGTRLDRCLFDAGTILERCWFDAGTVLVFASTSGNPCLPVLLKCKASALRRRSNKIWSLIKRILLGRTNSAHPKMQGTCLHAC